MGLPWVLILAVHAQEAPSDTAAPPSTRIPFAPGPRAEPETPAPPDTPAEPQVPADPELPADGIRSVAHRSLEVRRRTAPTLPTSWVGMGRVTCVAELVIDPQGRARDVQVHGCEGAFPRSVRDALRGWRWKPYLSEAGTPIPVRTTVRFTFSPTK